MELNNYVLDEIMKLEQENNAGLIISFSILKKHVDVDLINDANNNLFYQCSVDDILSSSITVEELIEARHCGWEYSNDKKYLIKKL